MISFIFYLGFLIVPFLKMHYISQELLSSLQQMLFGKYALVFKTLLRNLSSSFLCRPKKSLRIYSDDGHTAIMSGYIEFIIPPHTSATNFYPVIIDGRGIVSHRIALDYGGGRGGGTVEGVRSFEYKRVSIISTAK